jgi:hypothetical protein
MEKKAKKSGKQPKEIDGSPPRPKSAPGEETKPEPVQKKETKDEPMAGTPVDGKQRKVTIVRSMETSRGFLGSRSEHDMPGLAEELPEVQAPLYAATVWKNAIPGPSELEDRDCSTLRDVLKREDVSPQSTIEDDPEAQLNLMRLRGQATTAANYSKSRHGR